MRTLGSAGARNAYTGFTALSPLPGASGVHVHDVRRKRNVLVHG